MRCSICTDSRNRSEIDAMLIDGYALRTIGKRYQTSIAVLSRHRKHIPQLQKDAPPPVAPPPSSGTVIERLEVVIEDMRKLVRKAEVSGHLQTASATLKNITSSLELLAKLSGELQAGTQIAVGVNVNVRQKWDSSDLSVLRWALARHVGRMITYAPEAIEELRQLAAAPCPECNRTGCSHDLL